MPIYGLGMWVQVHHPPQSYGGYRRRPPPHRRAPQQTMGMPVQLTIPIVPYGQGGESRGISPPRVWWRWIEVRRPGDLYSGARPEPKSTPPWGATPSPPNKSGDGREISLKGGGGGYRGWCRSPSPTQGIYGTRWGKKGGPTSNNQEMEGALEALAILKSRVVEVVRGGGGGAI